MLRSMTGYGRGEYLSHDRRFKVEIKSVNHRYGDITIKLPRFLNPFEDRIRKRIAQELRRGKADVYINFESYTSKDISIRVNTAFSDAYAEALRGLAARYDLADGLTLPLLAAHPDLLDIEKNAAYDDETQAELWEALSPALEQALAMFNDMREAEGAALQRDLTDKRARIAALLAAIKERAPLIADEYATRLKERVAEAMKMTGAAFDEGRLLTEIALFADKSSVDEEITRLESHIVQLGAILDEPGQVGRKLDFLTQEMNREANTIGSKSNDLTLTRHVVTLKSELEKVREQVQNIE